MSDPVRDPRKEFYRPEIIEQLKSLPTASFSSYLMALAAHQRGLDVLFVRSLRRVSRHWSKLPDSVHPIYFLATDGRKTHSFNITMGDLTPLPAVQLSRDKGRTKAILDRAGLPVPPGILVKSREFEKAQRWMAGHPEASFVLKPSRGTLGTGLHLGLTPREVLELLSIKTMPEMVLETQFFGNEYRVSVVGDRVAATYQRWTNTVMGNGRDSIAALIRARNAIRAESWYFSSRLLKETAAQKYLMLKGRSLTDVPVLGERVALADASTIANGGDAEDATDRAPAETARVSIAACKALGLPNAGVDVFHDPRTGRVMILELNARAQLGGHTMTTKGTGSANLIAEAIIDHYFPAPAGFAFRRDSVLDMGPVLQGFARGAGEVMVPAPTQT
jgi:cyanophycin synthetase